MSRTVLMVAFLLLPLVAACQQEAEAPERKEETQEPEAQATPDIRARAEENAEILLTPDPESEQKAPSFEDAARKEERHRLIASIEEEGITDPKVLSAMRRVPRHLFVPEDLRERAYANMPLPIGHGQTISQPHIVAYMTELLKLEPDDTALEIGTGSGYQAAILGQLSDDVVTIEIIEPLAVQAAALLEELGYNNITAIRGDGYFGWPAKAPYDAIIVTAAAEHIPPPLIQQLRPGGRMVIPVGRVGWSQNLMLVEKNEAGEVTTRNLLPVRFVPFTRSE